jgi:D-alanyl-D-alanine endopeptidase (penicillin-binding protein 7)
MGVVGESELGTAVKRWVILCAAAALTVAATLTPVGDATAALKKAEPSSVRGTAKAQPQRSAAAKSKPRKVRRVVPARPSVGQVSGLRGTDDPLDLKSSVALVVDQHTDEVLFSKNPQAVLPIASITKLMTALVVTEAGLSLSDTLRVSQGDVDATSGNRSRLRAGTELPRGEMLRLALMASENRAAQVLGRTFPGGLTHFVERMNAKARDLGMGDTRFVEPTGLSSDNRSSAQDLALLVRAAAQHPVISEYSTEPQASVAVGARQVQFRNSNGLVRNPEWDILLQKTGYIAAAGRCVVMQAQLAGRKLIMVLLDSAGKYTRVADAERIRHWLLASPRLPAAAQSVLPAEPAVPPATVITPAPPSLPSVSLESSASLGLAALLPEAHAAPATEAQAR